MAAPAMAVSQVDTLKNPCTLWMWNSLVASQPPSSAPAMPIRQVRMRPCCLRPGISMLAIRPAARPKTIHAMMLMTDSLARWSDREWAESKGRGTGGAQTEKLRAASAHSRKLRMRLPRSGATRSGYAPFPARAKRSVVVPAAANRVARHPEQGQDRAGDNDDDADRPDNGGPGDEADDEEYYAENDHLVLLGVGAVVLDDGTGAFWVLSQAGSPAASSARGGCDVMASSAAFPDAGAFAPGIGPAMPAASSTRAWTVKTSSSRVMASIRRTCCWGAASSRSRPARRACCRARTRAARPLESMNSRPSRSTMTVRPLVATTASDAATCAASATSSSPRSITTTWPSPSRVLSSTLTISGSPFRFSSKGRVWTRRGSCRQWSG